MVEAVGVVADEVDGVDVKIPVAELAGFHPLDILFDQVDHAQDQLVLVDHDLRDVGFHRWLLLNHQRKGVKLKIKPQRTS